MHSAVPLSHHAAWHYVHAMQLSELLGCSRLPPTLHSAPPSQTPPVWLAYTPEAFSVPGLASRLPAWAAAAAPHLRFNCSFFLAAGYSLYYLALEPLAGGSWTGGEQ